MQPLRNGTDRPRLLVDPWAKRLYDPATKTVVGRAGPFGRGRVVAALPLGLGQAVQLERPRIIVDPWGMRLRDPDGALIGDRAGIWINRLLSARAVHDTRRL